MILDNASTDDTHTVIEESRALGPFQYCRNHENIGPIRNIIKGPVELATGKFVWVLGHHNLMMPGGLSTVLTAISQSSFLDVFYVNFRCARYPDQWPDSAGIGYDGKFDYLGNKETEDRAVPQWHQLIRPTSGLCTQMYAHIVKRKVWRDYWTSKAVGPDYRDSLTTYPHTQMLVETVFNVPSYYVGKPVITIFNGAQAWGHPKTQCDVYLRGLPNLLSHFSEQGLPAEVMHSCKQDFAFPETTKILKRAIPQLGFFRLICVAALSCPTSFYVWRSFASAFKDSEYNALSRWLKRCERSLQNRRNWWIVNCRPARLIKAMFSSGH